MKKTIIAALLCAALITPAAAAGYNFLNAGIAYGNDDRHADAITWLDKAIAAGDLLPDQLHVAYVDRGAAHAALGDASAAAADYSAALKLEPDESRTLMARAFAYVAAGQPDLAAGDLATLKKQLRGGIATNFDSGLVEWTLGRYGDAADDFATAADQGDPYAWLWEQMANIRQAKALTAFRDLSISRPGLHIRTSIDFGWPHPLVNFYYGSGSEAKVFEATDAKDQDPGKICEANFYVAEWHLAHGEPADAKPLLQKAAENCPRGYIEFTMARIELSKAP